MEIMPGVHMPRVGLGTFRARGADAVAAMVAALQAGYRHIDTASIYKNYDEVREAIRQSGVPRADIFITSKVSPYEHSTERVRAAVHACCEGLGALVQICHSVFFL